MVFGGTGDDYLGLTQLSRRAIVSVELVAENGRTLEPCSGVFVHERWLLTAAHCSSGMPIRGAIIKLGDERACPERTLTSEHVVLHPTLDLAAIALAAPEPSLDLTPFVLPVGRPEHIHTGTLTLLAGYGDDELARGGRRQLLVEPIADATDDAWIVDGMGLTGACRGDSGGPLMHRDARTGAPLLLGILSEGDISCRGRDVYTRADLALPWLRELGMPVPTRGAVACQDIGGGGRCLGQLSVRCEDDVLHAELCTGAGVTCGYDALVPRFGCKQQAAGPCADLDQVGVCDDGTARWCDDGAPSVEACAEGGGRCQRAPDTGVVTCLEIEPR